MTRWPGGVVAVFVALCGCAPAGDAGDAGSDGGNVRLVSLGPHLTELVFSAGAGDRLVGAIAHSDYPAEALSVPRVGDAFALDMERLTELAPTHILAWHGGNSQDMLQALEERDFNVVPIEIEQLDDVAAALRRIGALVGTSAVSDPVARHFEQSLAELAERNRTAVAVTVFVQVAGQPLYTVSDLSPTGQLIQLCGGSNVFGELGTVAAGRDRRGRRGQGPRGDADHRAD